MEVQFKKDETEIDLQEQNSNWSYCQAWTV